MFVNAYKNNNGNAVLPDLASLRSYNPQKDGERVVLSCHTYTGYGGGTFIHVPGDTSTVDDGGAFIVTANGDRFKREWGTEDIGNVLAWGADPTGQNDSADAFQRAIDSQLTGTIIVPNEGVYLLDRPVKFWLKDDKGKRSKQARMVLRSNMWSHFGFFKNRAAIKPSSELNGAMFTGVYMADGLAFFGPDNSRDGNSYHALELDGYVNKVTRCTFNMPDDGIRAGAGANIDIIECHFIGCTNNIHAYSGGIVTTYTVERCLSQYCKHLMRSEGQLWGSRFSHNTWEQCSDAMVVGKVIFNCGFIGNWTEGGGGSEDDPNPSSVPTRCATVQGLLVGR
ncbi:hypothetical protein [Kushneria phosphatilytica]|uniref:hypothetical protein n=1 Tax=Kushneria phosphatilytica TaxID=657387 RepID=UPI0008D96759|nr:hypothetical protein [Kushneria phosphatilytica]OHV12107.1 hypothetical protein BH688_05500 [Kushneria phosphatilytica]